jgi:hypothetical protein
LQTHGQRLAALEKQAMEQSTRLFEQMNALGAGIQQTGREQLGALKQVAEGIAGQASVLGSLQKDQANLVHLQAVLHQNLAVLAGAGSFDQAVHSLTAAIHLLTARTGTLSSGRASDHPQAPPALRVQTGKAA